MKTKAIWDDDRGAGGENVYEPGSEIYRDLCKWLRSVHGCRGSRKGWPVGCAQSLKREELNMAVCSGAKPDSTTLKTQVATV